MFDFDGVVRHHDSIHEAEAAQAIDLRPGELASIAFQRELLGQMVQGGMTRDQWIVEVGRQASEIDGVGSRRANAPRAVSRWLADWGWVEPEMVSMIVALRDRGHRVALFTNGTDTTPAELEHHRLTGYFDPVFNSWDLGAAKPNPAVFVRVANDLGLEPNEVMFFDDTLANVTAAQGVGWRAHVFRSPVETRHLLIRHGLLD